MADGAFIISSGSGYTNSGFGTFSKLAAGAPTNASTVSLSTARAGSFSETLTLDPTGGNASGFSAALGADTVIITGKVAAPTGLAHGDVHMVTFEGLHYDFQATGDFVLARATYPNSNFQIQMQTSTLHGIAGISYNTQIAAALGHGERVNFIAADDTVVWVDGRPDTTLGIGTSQELRDGSVLVRISADSYKLIWHNGETLEVTDRGAFFDLSAALSSTDRPGSVQGLLGSDTGQATDLSLPDGTVLAQPVATSALLGVFADAWRVGPSQSLLQPATSMPMASAPMRFIAPDAASQSPSPGAAAVVGSGSTNKLAGWQDLTQAAPLVSSFVPADVGRPTGWDGDETYHIYVGPARVDTTQTRDLGTTDPACSTFVLAGASTRSGLTVLLSGLPLRKASLWSCESKSPAPVTVWAAPGTPSDAGREAGTIWPVFVVANRWLTRAASCSSAMRCCSGVCPAAGLGMPGADTPALAIGRPRSPGSGGPS